MENPCNTQGKNHGRQPANTSLYWVDVYKRRGCTMKRSQLSLSSLNPKRQHTRSIYGRNGEVSTALGEAEAESVLFSSRTRTRTRCPVATGCPVPTGFPCTRDTSRIIKTPDVRSWPDVRPLTRKSSPFIEFGSQYNKLHLETNPL